MDRNLRLENKILEIVKTHPNGTWPRILLAKSNKELLDYINARTPLLQSEKYKLSTKVYWTLNGIENFPLCQNERCHKPLTEMNVGALDGYTRPFCSMSCSRGSSQAIEKDKKTRLARYGDENFRNRAKAVETNIAKYGARDIMQTDLGKERLTKTIEDKYGKKWFTQTELFQEKAKKTWHEKYGEDVDNPTQSKEVMRQIEQRNMEKYGVKNPMQVEEVRDKLKQTVSEKYGVEHIFQAYVVKDKSRQTFLERYGAEHNMQVNEIRKRRDETCMARYGTIYPIQTYEVREKLKKSLKAWYANNTRPFKTMYKYNGRKFDSSWELYYYIWLKENGVKFTFQPSNSIFPYVFQNETHYYHPDFLVEDVPVEIKGDQFFKEDGTMQCPWRSPKWSNEDKAAIDMLYEAKRQCMLRNGVRILRGCDLEPMFEEIDRRHGLDFIEQFKVSKVLPK